MMEVVVTTGAIKHAKLQSNHHQHNNTQEFYRMDAPRAGSGVVRIDPLRFLAGYHTRRINQV